MIDQILELRAKGASQREIATELRLSPATVNRMLQKSRQAQVRGDTPRGKSPLESASESSPQIIGTSVISGAALALIDRLTDDQLRVWLAAHALRENCPDADVIAAFLDREGDEAEVQTIIDKLVQFEWLYERAGMYYHTTGSEVLPFSVESAWELVAGSLKSGEEIRAAVAKIAEA